MKTVVELKMQIAPPYVAVLYDNVVEIIVTIINQLNLLFN